MIQTAFLGDVVLTIPLLQALAERHGPVDVVTTPGAAALIETHPSVRRVIRWDKNGKDAPGAWSLGGQLRAEGYARVYLPHRSVRSAVVAWRTGASERIGFADAPLLARALYTRTLPRHKNEHESVRLLSLLGDVKGGGSTDWQMTLTADDLAAADRWLSANGVAKGFIALAPGSIWGTKRWPYYPELAAALDRQVVVVGGREDVALGQEIVTAAGGRARSAVAQLSLRESAALIKRAAVLVTNDSAPLHLATAVGTPILAIFGPTVPAFGYGPIRPGDRVAEITTLDCRPCSTHGPQVCPLGHHRCMKDQSAESIREQVEALLR